MSKHFVVTFRTTPPFTTTLEIEADSISHDHSPELLVLLKVEYPQNPSTKDQPANPKKDWLLKEIMKNEEDAQGACHAIFAVPVDQLISCYAVEDLVNTQGEAVASAGA